MKFEKIKTAADKRIALEKRGKETSVDLKAGDVLFVTENLTASTPHLTHLEIPILVVVNYQKT